MSGHAVDVKPPDVPGVWSLMWLLFMQPLKLHDMLKVWGLEKDPSFWSLRRRWFSGEGTIRSLVRHLILILMVGPIGALATTGALSLAMPVNWGAMLVGLAFGMALGVAYWLTRGVAGGTALGVALGVVCGTAMGVAGNVAGVVTAGMATGAIFGVVSGMARITAFGLAGGEVAAAARSTALIVVLSVALGMAGAMAGGMEGSVTAAAVFVLTFAATFVVVLMRVPTYLIEVAVVKTIEWTAPDPIRSPKVARWLPYRHHDLIHFPLPGLDRILIEIGTHDPALALQLITEAAATIAQAKAAQRAFQELLARDLEKAARDSAWSRIATLDGTFFPSPAALDPIDPLHTFIATAQDVQAAQTGGSQHRRRNQLKSALRRIQKARNRHSHGGGQDPLTARLNAVGRHWSELIEAKLDVLEHEASKDPELPPVFVVGSPLNPKKPDEVELFRVRRDLVTIIDRDLDDDRRGPLLLTGQRRMGKTSLLHMLPPHLGATTTISITDFQGLGGSNFGHAPHRWIVQTLAATLTTANVPDLAFPSPDTVTDAWGTALDWLKQVDAALARANHRALVTIDEIERLQDAVTTSGAPLAFLDFVRAAGDALHRIRLLLVSAHQLSSSRLGPKWADRLISAFPCHLGPLPREDAEQLLRKPVQYFPESVFDDAAVAAVLSQTGGHPYLIQLVGDQIVKRLNGATPRRATATAQDIERALDGASNIARSQLFVALWEELDDTDRTLLRSLAQGRAVEAESPAFRSLRDQSFVDLRDGTPAFVFPLFARWIRDYQS